MLGIDTAFLNTSLANYLIINSSRLSGSIELLLAFRFEFLLFF